MQCIALKRQFIFHYQQDNVRTISIVYSICLYKYNQWAV